MEPLRKLDLAESATIDKVALNNKMVSMRGCVIKVRVRTIHKMTRKIEQLKKKKCSCGYCTPMPTGRESICCQDIGCVQHKASEEEQECITQHTGFDSVCINRHSLEVSVFEFAQMEGPLDDNQPSHEGSDEQKEQNQKKAERLIEEIHLMKILKKDNITKYALGATEKFSDLAKQPKLPVETKVMARIADHPLVQKMVKGFRENHPDWKALVEYLLTKNTSREYKKRKSKQPRGKVKQKQAMQNSKGKSAKALTNMEAKDVLVKTYLKNKLGAELQEKGDNSKKKKNGLKNLDMHNSEQSNEEEDSASSGENGNIDGVQTKRKVVASKTKKVKPGKSVSAAQIVKAKLKIEEPGSAFQSEHSSEEEEEEEKDKARRNSQSDSDQESAESSYSDDETKPTDSKNKHNNKDTSKAKGKDKKGQMQKSKVTTKKSIDRGSIVVKRINLDELQTGEVPIEKGVPAVLLSRSERGPKQRTVVKDSFFAGSEDEEGDGGEYIGQEVDYFGNKDFDNDEDNETDAKEIKRGMNSKIDTEKGKKAFHSTFVGSLRKTENVSFMQNEDWKRRRQEERDQKKFGSRFSSRGRGEGRGGFSRGRGEGRGGSSRGRGEGRGGFSRGGGSSRGRGESRGGFSRGRGEGRGGASRGRGEGKANQKVGKKPGATDGPVHPSWEASKKRKMEQSKIQPFQGKKIKFDD